MLPPTPVRPLTAVAETAVLPGSEETEQTVLGAALNHPGAASYVVKMLDPADFVSLKHRAILEAMRDLISSARGADALLVGERLSDSKAFENQREATLYLHALVDTRGLVTHLDQYVEVLKDHTRRRATRRIAEDLAAGKLEIPEAIERLRGLETDAVTVTPSEVFVRWPTFWDRDHSQAEWVFEDVLARGRGHALYAGHKEGKSLFTLYLAASVATGTAPCVVVYLDYEMSEQDVFERLADMGYGPESDLSRLRYALLPSLPPLDTADGARALAAIIDRVEAEWPQHHVVVIIDTISRAVAGEENDADTFRAFYAHTGIELKRRGATWARLDHGGKDPTKGMRGASAKGDDVDVVWRLARSEKGVTLQRDAARMSWVPEKVSFGIQEDPLRYIRIEYVWPAGTSDTAELLDRLQIPLEASANTAVAALKAAGDGRRKQVVLAALKWRRERLRGAA